MLEISFSKTEFNLVRFVVNSLQLLPKLCLDPVTKLELEGMIARIMHKVKNNDEALRAAILLENIEKLNRWYDNKDKKIFLELTKEITMLLSQMLKEYLIKNEIFSTIKFQKKVTLLFKDLYTNLYNCTELRVNPLTFMQKLKDMTHISSLEEV